MSRFALDEPDPYLDDWPPTVEYDVREALDDVDRANVSESWQEPIALLPAFTTWHSLESLGLTPLPFCYVLGCHQVAVRTARHQQFGIVSCCADHPLADFVPTPVPTSALPADRPNEGPMAPLPDRPFTRPPSGQYADIPF
jgi:hypothetical protein